MLNKKRTIMLLALFCIVAFAQEKGAFTDPRDGQSYRTVKIGNHTWMAENLNYKSDSSSCYWDRRNDKSYCGTYGRLYAWESALKDCPAGWHLPGKDEWDNLVQIAGGKKAAGKKLKSKTGWASNAGASGNGTDDFGFSAMPGGHRNDHSDYDNAEWYGYWWSAEEHKRMSEKWAYYRYMINYSYYDGVNERDGNKKERFSVRCVKDF